MGKNAGTHENVFRQVPVHGNGARVLPLEVVPVPGHGAQILARATTKSYVQTSVRYQKAGTGTWSERGIRLFDLPKGESTKTLWPFHVYVFKLLCTLYGLRPTSLHHKVMNKFYDTSQSRSKQVYLVKGEKRLMFFLYYYFGLSQTFSERLVLQKKQEGNSSNTRSLRSRFLLW